MNIRYLLLFVIIVYSCSKDDSTTPHVNKLQQKLILRGHYEAISFIVNGENVLAPDTSQILGGPLSYVKIDFNQNDSMVMKSEIYRLGAYDQSGPMVMKWSIDSTETKIKITDNILWTSKIFTGTHNISFNNNDQLIITGSLLNVNYPFEMILE